MKTIYKKLAALSQEPAELKEAQEAIKEWFDLLNEMGTSLDAFKGLGQLYL